MNIYVQFSNNIGFLNIKPANAGATEFDYISLFDNSLQTGSEPFSEYVRSVTAPNAVQYYFYTTASTPEELYSLHPELFI